MMEPPGAPRNNNAVSCGAPEFSLGGGELKAAAGEERSPTLVFVRLRPMSEEEKGTGSMSCIEIVNNTDVYLTSDSEPDHHRLPGRHFRFDATFPDTATQEQVYAASTAHLVEGVLQGGNGTVFCYGATGTGKTYTMLGTLENPGLMMLAIKDLFSNVGRSGHHGNHSIQLSYLEVHNEVIKDLLSPGRRLLLRQDGKGTVVVGLNHYTAHSAEEAIKLLQQGNRNRTTEPPRVNERPHAILQVIVEYRSMYKGSISQVGKLSLIDLAGSESALFALKTCINDPVEGKKRRPYRSTKLAQLLKDSIEGSHNIVMITNINPSNVSFCETQNTLYWADRAKLLKTKACSAANKEAVKLVLELQDGDSGLQIEAFSTGADRETVHVPDSATDVAKISLEKENVVLAAENAELRQKVKILEAEIVKMKEHHLVQLEKQADIAEARLGNQRVGIQHTCTHFLDLPEDCITDILLRLPQDSPSCLLRASLVCKSLLSIVSDPGFLRVLRALHPTPHLSGFFEDQVNPKFVPTTAFAFSLPAAMPRGGCYAQSILDCRHSRALFLVYGPSMVLLVWELVTGKRKYVPMPVLFESAFYVPPSGAVVCAVDDCDHRGCHCHGGHFFLVLASPTMYDDIGSTTVWVYSSETGAWSEPYLVEMAYSVSRAPSTLVGRTVYLGLGAFEAGCALEYDLVRHDLAVFEIPSDLLVLCDGNIIIIPAEDGRLGLASVKDSSLSLWLCDDNACWTAHRVIDLDIPAREGYINIRGFAEGVNIIFVSVDDDDGVIFAIEIKSERVRRLGRLFEPPSSEMIFPLVSF